MKILLLCLRYPYPPSDGGTIAMYNMAMALDKAGAEVKIAALNTKKHFIDLAKVPESFLDKFKPEAVFLDAAVNPLPALLNLFRNDSYNISRFDIPEFHLLIDEILKRETFDVIQLESLFVTPYLSTIRKNSKAKVIFRSHNVEYIIWERLASSSSNTIKKWYLNFLSKRLKQYEINVLNEFDAIIALTNDDKKIFEATGNGNCVYTSPIGLNVSDYKFSNVKINSVSAFHLGSMDWLPNIEGIDWLMKEILPLIKQAVPGLVIHLAGKNMPQRIFDLKSDNLHVEGKIDDAKKFMSDKNIMLVPLLSGGGMRVKIIEGMAMGKTIISTSIGAEGIKYTNHKNILIADSPLEFTNCILKCYSDPDYCNEIGVNARKLAEEVYENKILGEDLLKFYNSLPVRVN